MTRSPRPAPKTELPTSEESSNSEERWINWSGLPKCSCGEKPVLPRRKIPQRRDRRSWSHKVQDYVFDVKSQVLSFVRWKCLSRWSTKTSLVFLKLFPTSRWPLLFATMWPVWSREMESPVTRTWGSTSITAHPGASKPCCFSTGICIKLFHWLNWCGPKRNTAMSRSGWMACNMKSREIIRHLKMVVF